MAQRKFKTIREAVTHETKYDCGQHYALAINGSTKLHRAVFKNVCDADTFDRKEDRTARMALRVYGSFVEYAKRETERLAD